MENILSIIKRLDKDKYDSSININTIIILYLNIYNTLLFIDSS